MASRENRMRTQVTGLLRNLDAIAVENPVGPGTPDVNCVLGWIELKSIDRPKKEGTPVDGNLEHFTQQQRNFLKRRWRSGGGAWLLVKMGRDWLIFDGLTAADKVGKGPDVAELCELALEVWPKAPTSEELTECLKKTSPPEKGSASFGGDAAGSRRTWPRSSESTSTRTTDGRKIFLQKRPPPM